MQTTSASPSPASIPTVTVTTTVTAKPSPLGWLQRNGDQLSVGLILGIVLALVGIGVRRLSSRRPIPHADELHRLLTDARRLFSGRLLTKDEYASEYYVPTMQQLEPLCSKGIRDEELQRLVGELLNESRNLLNLAPQRGMARTKPEMQPYRKGYGMCENLAKRAIDRLTELRTNV